ncbi:MAG: response regulator transcription factor, partial [Bacteroidota bacterium]
MKILIADDHAMVRDGLKQLLTKLTIDLHIDEVSNGVNAIKLIKNNDYDFVILDISLPDISGLDILKRLKEHNNPTKVLILSMHPEEQFAVRALKLGAMGYITKD